MEILEIKNDRISLKFNHYGYINSNKLDVLIGPNGSGKTEALTILARFYRKLSIDKQRKLFPEDFLESNRASRVIVQTFSPFTRFPSPPKLEETLLDIFHDGKYRTEEYISIGLHRGYRGAIGSISQYVLEDALFRISEFPKSINYVFQVLSGIDFSPDFFFLYRNTLKLNEKNEEGIEEFIEYQIEKPHKSILSAKFQKELSSSSVKELSSTIHKSFEIINFTKIRNLKNEYYEFHVNAENIRQKFYILQAFSLLRRLGLISLTKCEVLKLSEKYRIDISAASSGEQQMLCSIIGLASSIRNNSLILIDEPELSLHPTRQSQYIQALSRVMDLVQDCHFIVCTHSPLLVQAAQSIDANINQINQGLSSNKSIFQKSSISVEEALIDAFNTPIQNSSYVSNQIFKTIVAAETGSPSNKNYALKKLLNLKKIYGKVATDNNTIKLLNDAIRIIKSNDLNESDE